MADTPTNAPADGQAAADQAQPALPPLVINVQYVKDLSLEVPNAPEVFSKLTQQPQVQVDVDIKVRRLAEASYEVALHLDCKGTVEQDTVFIVEVAYAGVFTLNNVAEEHVGPMLLIECPRLLFPFARNIVATVTREGAVPPLLINPIDFRELYMRQMQRQAEEAPGHVAEAAPELGGAGASL